MNVEVFETFYKSDWGANERARSARNFRSQTCKALGNAVVKGRVNHPVYGEGFDVWYVRPALPGERPVADLRVTPQGRTPQLPPRHVRTEVEPLLPSEEDPWTDW